MEIQVFPDLDSLSNKAAEIFVNEARKYISLKGRFTVVVSGGSTPKKFYSILAKEPYCSKVDWRYVHFFWADERCVSKENEDSNFKLVFDTLLSKIPVIRTNIHRIKGEENSDRGAAEYEMQLKEFFGISMLPVFDLIILGIGEDGHTASLFPGSSWINKNTIRLAVPVYMEKPKLNRISLTIPVINNAMQILFLVSGSLKAEIVHEIIENKNEQYPAALIKPVHGNLTWLIDKFAAAKICF